MFGRQNASLKIKFGFYEVGFYEKPCTVWIWYNPLRLQKKKKKVEVFPLLRILSRVQPKFPPKSVGSWHAGSVCFSASLCVYLHFG